MTMLITELAIGVLAGVINACGGGGSFVLFPALLWLGLPPIVANATSSVIVSPGTVTILLGYRDELKAHKASVLYFTVISLVGGVLGAILLLNISNRSFEQIVPVLLLLAVLLLTFNDRLRSRHAAAISYYHPLVAIAVALCAVYNGFFGAGTGIMLFGIFSYIGMQNLHEMNALRALICFVSNIVSVVFFIRAGIIDWQHALPMAVGACLGGHYGVRLMRILPDKVLNYLIIGMAWLMTLGIGLKIYF